MLNIYVNTWGNYNTRGADGGEWLTLPMDEDDLRNTLDEIAHEMNDHDPEWFINDYEWTSDIEPRDIEENESIIDLNAFIEDLASMDEYDQMAVCAAVEAFGYTLEEATEKQRRGCFTFWKDCTMEDVAEELVRECYFTKETPDIFERYFDYEAFARDLSFDGYTETDWGVISE